MGFQVYSGYGVLVQGVEKIGADLGLVRHEGYRRDDCYVRPVANVFVLFKVAGGRGQTGGGEGLADFDID
mgnify:CR=1 FL=1